MLADVVDLRPSGLQPLALRGITKSSERTTRTTPGTSGAGGAGGPGRPGRPPMGTGRLRMSGGE